MTDETLFDIALSIAPGIGPFRAKKLLESLGSSSAIFREKPHHLSKLPEISEYTARILHENKKTTLNRASQELGFIEKNHIAPVFFKDEDYPERLRQCSDGPLMLYSKGRFNYNSKRMVAIVGTRKATNYGREFCDRLIKSLKEVNAVIVSGLAYGIDICAHQCALKEGLATIGCLAHGLDRLYPSAHISVAKEMIENGGLVTEYLSETRPDRELFPTRNRIIAGITDCTIVVETDLRGGSIITAHLANSYARDVFALPGRIGDVHSSGCNDLIKKNIAALLSSPEDVLEYMNWGDNRKPRPKQLDLFQFLDPQEVQIVKALENGLPISIDFLYSSLSIDYSFLSNKLLELELKGLIKCLPGKTYKLV